MLKTPLDKIKDYGNARLLCIYFQYLLGKYFSAPTGEEQIRWLLGPKTPDPSELIDVQKIGVHDFNASVKLFRYSKDLKSGHVQISNR